MNTNPTKPEGADRSLDLLSGILSNPEALGRIASVLGAVMSASPTDGARPASEQSGPVSHGDIPPESVDTSTAPPPPIAADSTGGTIGGLGNILSDPALLERLPQILAVMKPLLAASAPKPMTNAPQKAEDCRNNLLLALKPFLSAERCDAIDSIIRISHLGNVFSQLK